MYPIESQANKIDFLYRFFEDTTQNRLLSISTCKLNLGHICRVIIRLYAKIDCCNIAVLEYEWCRFLNQRGFTLVDSYLSLLQFVCEI